jgi:hypothetical protein
MKRLAPRPETLCQCGHPWQMHGNDCFVYLGRGAKGSDRKGFCACKAFKARKK